VVEELFGLPGNDAVSKLGNMNPAIKGGSLASKQVIEIVSALKGE
jgi:hypothetical protein